ncbi:MAG: S-adenosylmethionine:tRNA ribosyltransferase-isomerase [Bacteroidetes bacterium]|nr:S-adenosylmethionine:tRNA ribosyltransferase-isomerase [Bacteroidota bacterium]
MHPKDLQVAAYDYPLPASAIALQPLPERDASRLLVWRGGALYDSGYRDLPDWLPTGTRMVFNDTRVTEARLHFPGPGQRALEVFILEPADGSMLADTLSQQGTITCRCLVGGASRWKTGLALEKTISLPSGSMTLRAWNKGKAGDAFQIQLAWEPSTLSFAEVLHLAGQLPLPPYLRRAPQAMDAERYQTMYAAREGSVAAPTAGLHFTESLFARLEVKGIQRRFVTLHVGAGTFRPVTAEQMADHPMHGEFSEVSRAVLEWLIDAGGPVLAVGTTSLRTLESLYWMGCKLLQQPDLPLSRLDIGQWEPYGHHKGVLPATSTALKALAGWMDEGGLTRLVTRTQLLIAPGYTFQVANGLVTNFHQPRSTLLLLVAAWMGDRWRKMYEYALDQGYRFLSYGDGCLIGPFFNDGTSAPVKEF